VAILGMSADSVKALALFKQKYKFNFSFLSDADHQTIEAYGAWQQKQFMGRKFMGIARSSFLIGKTGKIEAVWPAVHAKGHASEVLKHLSDN
jgi:peroxiredoxin Q/BCP